MFTELKPGSVIIIIPTKPIMTANHLNMPTFSLNKKIGDKTLFEKKNESKNNQIIEAKKNDNIKKLLDAFDDADLINVQKDDN